MKVEQQVCSLELAKKLKELGVPQESAYYWSYNDGMDDYYLTQWDPYWPDKKHINELRKYAAFTVGELGEMLHNENIIINSMSSTVGGEPHEWCVTLSNKIEHIQAHSKKHEAGITEIYHHDHVEIEDTEADARAKMMVHLLENKIISVQD